MIRYALLYHNGGMVFDTDVLFHKTPEPELLLSLSNSTPSSPIHLLSYESYGQRCPKGSFSSNILGATKGSPLMKKIYEAQTGKLTAHCHTEEEYKKEIVCCMDDVHRKCHIPWTGLGEGVSHGVLKNYVAENAKFFQEKEKVPVVQKSHSEDHWKVTEEVILKEGGRVSCFPERNQLLHSPHVEITEKVFDGIQPLEKVAYHMFNSLNDWGSRACTQLLNEHMAIGKLYWEGLGLRNKTLTKEGIITDTRTDTEKEEDKKIVGLKLDKELRRCKGLEPSEIHN